MTSNNNGRWWVLIICHRYRQWLAWLGRIILIIHIWLSVHPISQTNIVFKLLLNFLFFCAKDHRDFTIITAVFVYKWPAHLVCIWTIKAPSNIGIFDDDGFACTARIYLVAPCVRFGGAGCACPAIAWDVTCDAKDRVLAALGGQFAFNCFVFKVNVKISNILGLIKAFWWVLSCDVSYPVPQIFGCAFGWYGLLACGSGAFAL